MFYYVESLVKPGEVTISLSWMTFWWCSFLRILISRIAVMGNYARYRNDEEYINQTKKKKRERHKIAGNRGTDTYALALVIHADLLERDDLLRLRLPRHVHLPTNNAAGLERRFSRDWKSN